MTTVVVEELILILVLNLLLMGLADLHTSQSQPIKGTPVLVPEPRMVKCNKINIFKTNKPSQPLIPQQSNSTF